MSAAANAPVDGRRAEAVLLYDGDCAFCSSTVRVMQRLLRRLPSVEPYQFADLDRLGVTAEQCAAAVQWIGTDGRRLEAHHAVAQVLVDAGGVAALVGRFIRLPGVSMVAGLVYRWVARHRHQLPGGTAACAMRPPVPPDR